MSGPFSFFFPSPPPDNRGGEGVRMRGCLTEIFRYHPSLSLCDIPTSLIYRKGCGTLYKRR